jgi:hypothetical protein
MKLFLPITIPILAVVAKGDVTAQGNTTPPCRARTLDLRAVYVDPLQIALTATTYIDYYSPGSPWVPLTLLVTGHVENIDGGWPLSLPDNYGNEGSHTGPPVGCGLKEAQPLTVSSSDEFSISLTDNPATASTNAVINGLNGVTATVSVINMLGQTIQQFDPLSVEPEGTIFPLPIGTWPSGHYIVVASGSEGSRARAMLSVQH